MKPVALRAAGLTDTGSVREHNEDAFLVAGNLLVVADGMGGHRAGEVAARICVEELGALFEPAEGPRPWWRFWGPGLGGQARLADALRRANRAIFDASRGAPEHQGMGTTVVALWRDGPTLHYAHVGDSRLYRLRDGTLTQLTADHSLLERCKRAGLVDAADDADFPYKNVIVRALGLQPGVIVDAASTPVAPGDRYLLCSDGLTDLLDGRTIQARLAADASPSEVALGLVQDALEAGGVDNVTVVVAHLEPGEP
ncbi:MAG: serine/threonine-protein phosphatase [Myxococcales bacterium]|nr:serine/threonine-protein phosphatase [Myxococcales bacterium]MCB9546225.1 serine/threonine-protein phosphatase [Myxococcales bacterium]